MRKIQPQPDIHIKIDVDKSTTSNRVRFEMDTASRRIQFALKIQTTNIIELNAKE